MNEKQTNNFTQGEVIKINVQTEISGDPKYCTVCNFIDYDNDFCILFKNALNTLHLRFKKCDKCLKATKETK